MEYFQDENNKIVNYDTSASLEECLIIFVKKIRKILIDETNLKTEKYRGR